MASKGPSFNAPVKLAYRSEPSSRTARCLAASSAALLSTCLLAFPGCSLNLQEVFDTGGGAPTTSNGGGGSGGTSSTGGSGGSGGSSTSSTSSTSTSSTSSGTGGSGGMTSTTSTSSGGPVTVTALPEESVYRYWDKGTVVGAWSDPGYNDNTWALGKAPLGYGDPYIATTVSFGPNAGSKYISTWFRTTFDVASAASVSKATIELKVDDGAVVFLNGSEWVRWNMPDGNIFPNTLASSIVDGASEGSFIGFDVDPALLVNGENVLAIEVHQSVANSSDLGIDARITLQVN